MSQTEEEVSHMCQVPGCNKPGDQYSLPDAANLDAEVFYFYCHHHAHENGFCWSCGNFYGGNEEFEVSKLGLCGDCEDAYLDEYDEDEDNLTIQDLDETQNIEESQQEPKPLMRCRTCKFKFNQAKHTTYEDSEQRHVKCPKCGEVYFHDDFELQPEDYAMMDFAREARDGVIASAMRMFEERDN